jgi:hypothetical protein
MSGDAADIKSSHLLFQDITNKWVAHDDIVPYGVHFYLLSSIKLNEAVKFLIFVQKATGVIRPGYRPSVEVSHCIHQSVQTNVKIPPEIRLPRVTI